MSFRLLLLAGGLVLANQLHASNFGSLGMAMSGVSLDDHMAMLVNPASPGDTNVALLQAFAEDRYGIDLLRSCGLAYATAKGNRRFALETIQRGEAPYRQNQLSLSAGTTLFIKSRFGIALHAYNRSSREAWSSTTTWSWGATLGWWLQPFPKTTLGLAIDHPESLARPASIADERLGFRYGFSWCPLPVVNWSVEVRQRSGEPFILATGIRYQASRLLGVSCGWRSDRMLISMGSSINFSRWRMDLYFEQHRQLGARTGAALLFFLSKRS